jgi:hypothetical protein
MSAVAAPLSRFHKAMRFILPARITGEHRMPSPRRKPTSAAQPNRLAPSRYRQRRGPVEQLSRPIADNAGWPW